MEKHRSPQTLRELLETLRLNFPYRPMRYETTDGIQDSNYPNQTRVELAKQTLSACAESKELEPEADIEISDLISNLLHLAHSQGYDLANILTRSVTNFNAEAGTLRNRR